MPTGERDGRALRVAGWIDRVARATGAVAALATLGCVALAFGLVLLRNVLGLGPQAMQEAVLWLHALAFLAGLAWALQADRHVRVDVLRARLGPRGRAWVELLGTLCLLLPVCAFAVWISLPYVEASWRIGEASREPGGLPALYLLKSLIPLAAALLALQGVAVVLRALDTLRGARR